MRIKTIKEYKEENDKVSLWIWLSILCIGIIGSCVSIGVVNHQINTHQKSLKDNKK